MRDWLAKKYPNGVGLGDLISEYMELRGHYGGDRAIRKEEVKMVLNYLNGTKCTPVFSEEGEMLVRGVKLGET